MRESGRKQKYFPQGIATDSAFCNREQERALLKSRIEAQEHSVLVAPRRYGKTSLMAQVLTENSFEGTNIDFFFILSQEDVINLLTTQVSKLMLSIMPKGASAIKQSIKHLSSVHSKLTFNFLGQQLEIKPIINSNKTITDVLLALDDLADKVKKNCVLIFDEFQQIGELNESHAIEASIRHAVERSQCVSYIFCGSKRHLLNKMFSDRTRPLYHLCDLMSIGRIASPYYHSFLKNIAKRRWRKIISTESINEILQLSKNHPYYVNALCRVLWKIDAAPNPDQVFEAWANYVEQQAPWIISDISKLTLNRRKMLQSLANKLTKEPQSIHFLKDISISPGSVRKSLEDLYSLDMIYRDNEGYVRVLDPAIEFYLNTQQ
jgi:AAA+ ATPase superfamily predicted ATPase